MSDTIKAKVTIEFPLDILTTLPRFAGMTPEQMAADVQRWLDDDTKALMEHMCDYPLKVSVGLADTLENKVAEGLGRLHDKAHGFYARTLGPYAISDLVKAVSENHQWHIDHDDHNGYPGSELCTMNTAALGIPDLPGENSGLPVDIPAPDA